VACFLFVSATGRHVGLALHPRLMLPLYPLHKIPTVTLMPATHEELQRKLTQLEGAMPWWLSACPDTGDFILLFAGHADPIIDAASADEYPWVSSEIDRILATHLGPVDDVAL
jgi:hypothetical protein